MLKKLNKEILSSGFATSQNRLIQYVCIGAKIPIAERWRKFDLKLRLIIQKVNYICFNEKLSSIVYKIDGKFRQK